MAKIKLTEEQITQCWETVYATAPKSIAWNHYEFFKETGKFSVDIWRTFLTLPTVEEWFDQERNLLQSTELAKLTTNIKNNSVGQAQLISAYTRFQNENKQTANTGPIFIYSYVPLNQEQRHAPNTQELKEDIFFVPPTELKLSDPSST
jgi:hypothetical protein